MYKKVSLLVACGLIVACGSSDLDRSDAVSLINESPEIKEEVRSLPFTGDGFERGVAQGKWASNKRIRVDASEGVKSVSDSRLELLTPASREVTSVTGITSQIASDEGVKIAEFTWSYKGVPDLARRYVKEGGTGSAIIQLYDDGWRVTNIDLETLSDPFQLSGSEVNAQEKDEAQETARREAENLRIAKERNEYLARVMKATTPTSDSVFSVAAFKHRNRVSDGKVTLTDVGIDSFNDYGNPLKLFFFDLFPPKRTDVDLGRRGCFNRTFIPKIESAWYSNVTWGWKAYEVRIHANCTKVVTLFDSEEKGERFRAAVEASMDAWISKHGDLVVEPKSFAQR